MDFQHDLKTFSPSINPDGSVHVSYTGSVVLVPKQDFNALIALHEANDKNTALLSQASEALKQRNEALDKYRDALKTSKEDVTNDYLTSHRGGYDKQGCGHRADAEILAAAVHGASIEQLCKKRYTYNRYGHKKVYSRGKIFSALSVKKPEDYQRIMDLYTTYPEVFNCSVEVVIQWYQKKYMKGGKQL